MTINSYNTPAHGNLKNRAVFAVRNYWSGLLFGIGFIAFAVSSLFHQLLQWHHFYDLSTEETGIFSDGLLNLFSYIFTLTGLFLLASLRRRNALWPKRWIGSAFMGSGMYLLFDGLIVHKIFRFHQIHSTTNILPYDIAWNVSGAIFLLTGFLMVLQTKKVNHRNRSF